MSFVSTEKAYERLSRTVFECAIHKIGGRVSAHGGYEVDVIAKTRCGLVKFME